MSNSMISPRWKVLNLGYPGSDIAFHDLLHQNNALITEDGPLDAELAVRKAYSTRKALVALVGSIGHEER